MRTYLSPGTVIPVIGEGATRQVYIEQVIGEGASCIVYDGFFVDVPGVKERCRLKECYPLDAKVVRQSDRLVWHDPAERLYAQKRFQNIRQISFDMRYNPEVGNQITKSGYYENGNNFYLIMDINHGQTLDKENTKDITRILRIALKLTQLVGKLHNLGCRYLDLKPDNILVSNDPDPDIWLFDFDSLVPMDNSNAISYSKGWAAPELVQGKFSSLCNATDLYSIGAILFRKIMGRSVSNDDIGLFANWDFAGELFDDVNPKVQRYLREIFKKTLSASVKRRYQSAAELELTLEQTLGEVGKPYVISNIPDNSSNFVGRDQELLDIRDVFTSGNHIVFLTGIGGIGKSELAKRYGNMQQSNYDAVIFASFEDSINSLLLDIEIQNFDGDDKQKIKQLNRLLDRRILLVIDNMDAEEIPDFNVLAKLKCDILITSRLDWKEYSFPAIEIDAMSEVDQFGLFLNEYGGALDITQQQAVIRILSYIEGYTLLIPLIAKQMRKGHLNFDDMALRIHTTGIKAASAGKVRHLKDGMALSGSVYSILAEVLNIANFSEEEEYVMRSISLLSEYRIDQAEFLRWIGKEYTNQIDDLVFSGWVYRSIWRGNTVLSLHSVISELCVEELKPSLSNCQGIRNRILLFADDFETWHKNPTSFYYGGYAPTHIRPNIQHQLDSYLGMMEGVLLKCDWSDPDNILFWLLIIERVTNVISGDFHIFEHFLTFVIDAGFDALDVAGEPLPRVSYAALAMEAIALQQDNLEEALLFARHVVDTIESVKDPVETLFKMCFHFYQWVCVRNLDFEDYWNTPGFIEFAEYVKSMWDEVIEAEIIGFESTSVCVLNNGEEESCDLCVDEAIEQAFEDYCFKISPEGIKRAKEIFFASDNSVSDIIAAAANAADTACDFYGINIPKSNYVETGERLSDEEIEISRFVRVQQETVNSMLRCRVDNPMGLWFVMQPRPKSDSEKEELRNKLSQVDTMMLPHIPSVLGRTVFAYELTKMEAAFTYAYAVAEDWEKYRFHKDNLLAYYKILIDGKSMLAYFKASTINEINSGLPGLASLLNKYGKVLPEVRALELLSGVIDLMEKYHAREHLPADSLFEVYKLALDFAEKANQTAAVVHYQKRVNRLSSVHFSAK